MGLVDLLTPSKSLDEVSTFPIENGEFSLHLMGVFDGRPKFALHHGGKSTSLTRTLARYTGLFLDEGYVTKEELFASTHEEGVQDHIVNTYINHLRKILGNGHIISRKGYNQHSSGFYLGDPRPYRREKKNMVSLHGLTLNHFTGCVELPNGEYRVLGPAHTEILSRIIKRKGFGASKETLYSALPASDHHSSKKKDQSLSTHASKINKSLGGAFIIQRNETFYIDSTISCVYSLPLKLVS